MLNEIQPVILIVEDDIQIRNLYALHWKMKSIRF